MTITSTSRLGMTQWSDNDDAPITREQMNNDFAGLEELVAIGLKGTLATRPPAGTRERLYLVNAGAGLGTVYWDTGAAWVTVRAPSVTVLPHTWSVPGDVLADTIPGFFVPKPAGQSVRLLSVRHKIQSGTGVNVALRIDGVAATGYGAFTSTAAAQSVASPLAFATADVYLDLVTSAPSGSPKGLTVSAYLEYTA